MIKKITLFRRWQITLTVRRVRHGGNPRDCRGYHAAYTGAQRRMHALLSAGFRKAGFADGGGHHMRDGEIYINPPRPPSMPERKIDRVAFTKMAGAYAAASKYAEAEIVARLNSVSAAIADECSAYARRRSIADRCHAKNRLEVVRLRCRRKSRLP